MSLKNRFYGAIYGAIVGDALGAPIEYESMKDRLTVNGMLDATHYEVTPGVWTDEGGLFLSLSQSLLDVGKLDNQDILTKFLGWYQKGHNTPLGCCNDIHPDLLIILELYRKKQHVSHQPVDILNNNGYTVPQAGAIALYFLNNNNAASIAYDYSRLVNTGIKAAEVTMLLTHLITGAIKGLHKDILLSPEYIQDLVLSDEIRLIANGLYKDEKLPTDDETIGDALMIVLKCFKMTENFASGALMVVNHSIRAGFVASIYGQLAGSYYGLTNIPEDWLLILSRRDFISAEADKLYEHYQHKNTDTSSITESSISEIDDETFSVVDLH